MRRLLCIAIGLVLAVVIVLAIAKIKSSDSYVARSTLAQIRAGMTREQVLDLVEAQPRFQATLHGWTGHDSWCCGRFVLCTWYNDWHDYNEGNRPIVEAILLDFGEDTLLDKFLTLSGYPNGIVSY